MKAAEEGVSLNRLVSSRLGGRGWVSRHNGEHYLFRYLGVVREFPAEKGRRYVLTGPARPRQPTFLGPASRNLAAVV